MYLANSQHILEPEAAACLKRSPKLISPHDDIKQLIDKDNWERLNNIIRDHIYSYLVDNTREADLLLENNLSCHMVKVVVMHNLGTGFLKNATPEHQFVISASLQLQSAADKFLGNLRYDGMKHTGGSGRFFISAPTAEELVNAINSALDDQYKFMAENIAIPEQVGEHVIRGVFTSQVKKELPDTGQQIA